MSPKGRKKRAARKVARYQARPLAWMGRAIRFRMERSTAKLARRLLRSVLTGTGL